MIPKALKKRVFGTFSSSGIETVFKELFYVVITSTT